MEVHARDADGFGPRRHFEVDPRGPRWNVNHSGAPPDDVWNWAACQRDRAGPGKESERDRWDRRKSKSRIVFARQVCRHEVPTARWHVRSNAFEDGASAGDRPRVCGINHGAEVSGGEKVVVHGPSVVMSSPSNPKSRDLQRS